MIRKYKYQFYVLNFKHKYIKTAKYFTAWIIALKVPYYLFKVQINHYLNVLLMNEHSKRRRATIATIMLVMNSVIQNTLHFPNI